MRILVLAACPFPWPRGTPIRIHRLTEALSQLGHELTVVTYHLGDKSAELPFDVVRASAFPGYSKTRPGPSIRKLLLLDPLLLITTWRLIRAQQSAGRAFDLIHAHHIEGLLVALGLRLLRVPLPIVYDVHTTIGAELPSFLPGWMRHVGRWVTKLFDRQLPLRADHLITVTEELEQNFISGGVAGANVTTVINGVERGFIDEARTVNHRSVANEILFAGNLAQYQRIDLLLRAFARVLSQRPEVRLVIATEDDFSPHQALADELGVASALSLRYPQFDKLAETLGRASVLVNPRTVCAGIPQKLLNYMASGAPIVSCEGSAHVVKHEFSALVVANDDVDAMASAILRLLDDPVLGRRLAHNARIQVSAGFSWDAAARSVETVYQQVLATGDDPSSIVESIDE